MLQALKQWIRNKKILWAFGIVASEGLSVVKIIKRGNKSYFVANDGSMRLIK